MSEQKTKTVDSEEEKTKTNRLEVGMMQKDISQIIASLRTLLEDCTFSFSQEGLSIKAMDCSHVALIDIALPNANFEKWDVNNDAQIAFRLDDSMKMINLFEPNSLVRIGWNNDDNILNFFNKSESYKIRTIEPNKADTPLPRIPFDSRIKFDQEITLGDFIKQLRKIETVSDYITFETSHNWFVLSGKGDSGEAHIKNERGQVSIDKRDRDDNTTYSLEYLLPFLKTLQKDRTIELAYSTAKPLMIRVNLGGSARMDFYLAPRVEN